MKKLGVTLVLIYVLWLFVFLPIICRKRVFSPFSRIDNKRNKEIEEYKNQARIVESLKYLRTIDTASSHTLHSQKIKNCTHLIIVIALKGTPEYKRTLTQLLAVLDKEIRSDGGDQTALFVCNSRANSIEISELEQYFPVVNLKQSGQTNEEDQKKRAWQSCMQLALSYKSNYTIFISDRLSPYTGFVKTSQSLITNKLNNYHYHGDLAKGPDWLFAYLYEPFNIQYFEFQELTVIAVVGAILFTYMSEYIVKNHHKRHKVMLGFFGAVVFVTLAYGNGKPYINELRRLAVNLLKVYEPEVEIPLRAVVMPRSKISTMLHYLKDIDCSLYVTFDSVWFHAMFTLDIKGYGISPTLFQYI